MNAHVLLSCRRCGARGHADVQLDIRDGELGIGPGTLNNEWALRWVRSHQEPEGRIVCEHGLQ